MVESKAATGADAPKERTTRNFCPPKQVKAHHWDIASPDGPTSIGVCRGCGAKRQFRNSTEYIPWNELTSNVGNAASANTDGNMPLDNTRAERKARDIRLSDE